MDKQQSKVGGRLLPCLAVAFALALAGTARAEGVAHWSGDIREASARFGIPEVWISRVMQAESGGRTMFNGRPITSSAGAMGLMQLMPGTWAEMRSRHGLGPDPYQPRDNILAGTAYLREMYDRFGYPGLFAAYNAGPRRYARHLATGAPLPAETVAYLVQVSARGAPAVGRLEPSGTNDQYMAAPASPAIFAVRRKAGAGKGQSGSDDQSDHLFAIRRTGP